MNASVRWSVLLVAVVLHLAVGPFSLASGLVVPPLALVVVFAVITAGEGLLGWRG